MNESENITKKTNNLRSITQESTNSILEENNSVKINIQNEKFNILTNLKSKIKNLDEIYSKYKNPNDKNILKDPKLLNSSLTKLFQIFDSLKNADSSQELREDMFEFIVRFVQHRQIDKDDVLVELLKQISLESLSFEFLTKNVYTEDFIQNSTVCMELLKESLNVASSRLLNDDCLFSLGGFDENMNGLGTLSMFNSTTGKWVFKSPMAIRWDFGVAVIDGKIYAAGGWSTKGKTSTIQVYDYRIDKWDEIDSQLGNRSSFGIASLNGFLYIAGGSAISALRMKRFDRYCPVNKQWKRLRGMNARRDGFQMVSLNGYLYAISGARTNTVERYDPETDKWTYVAQTNYAHYLFGAAVHQNKIYILSWRGFEVYHPEMDRWDKLDSLGIGVAPNLVSFRGKLWAIGGGDALHKLTATNSIYEYDTFIHRWNPLPDMHCARIHHCSIVLKHSNL